MKIIELRAEHIKRIKAVEIKPKDNVVILSGKNDQGKTSVLDSIWFAVGGKETLKDTPRPIRDGEKTAEITLDLGDMIVTRNWTANDKSYLKVENQKGFRYKSPQELLDTFIGKLSFDPLEFSRLDGRDQRDTLLEVIDLSIDLGELEDEKEVIYDQRTLKGRELKSALAQLEAVEPPSPDLPAEEISLIKLSKKLELAIESNNKRDVLELEANNTKEIIERKKLEAKELLMEVDELAGKRDEVVKEFSKLQRIDIDPIQAEIREAEITNSQIRLAKEFKESRNLADRLRIEHVDMTTRLDEIDNIKKKALKDASMPIEGLGISEVGITFEGVPFSQIGSAAKLKVSLALAMSLNPDLRVIRITDGSLLDDENMKIIREMADDNNFQIWIEKVDDTGKIGFYIEDGELKGTK